MGNPARLSLTGAATITTAGAALRYCPQFKKSSRSLLPQPCGCKHFEPEGTSSLGVVLGNNLLVAVAAAQEPKWSYQGLPLQQWGEDPKQKAIREQHDRQGLLQVVIGDVRDTSNVARPGTRLSRHYASGPQPLSSQELELLMLLQFSSERLVSGIAVLLSSSLPSPSTADICRSNCWTWMRTPLICCSLPCAKMACASTTLLMTTKPRPEGRKRSETEPPPVEAHTRFARECATRTRSTTPYQEK
mmetsp:Transcript_52639/g.104500  ORF Transcript_52639/g.104500 Transcript_52639/m.104500 type:complete len:246 (-) Transcript_52639:1167-1904(-)